MLSKYLGVILIINLGFLCNANANHSNTEQKLSTTVKWDVTAIKTSKSSFYANADNRMLSFQYIPEIENFSTDKSNFDLNLTIPTGVTDTIFKTKIVKNTLENKNKNSLLNIGVTLNGENLSKDNEITLKPMKNPSDQKFNFEIISAKENNKEIKPKDLKDEKWDGEITLAFTAYWLDNTHITP